MKNLKTNLDWALHYRSIGWSPFPVPKGSKIPVIKWGKYQTQIASENEIRAWWKESPDANIGIATGKVSGIVVVDIENGGDVKGFSPTVTSRTGGGGYHLVYKHPDILIRNSVKVIAPLTDIRGDGGYFLAPPSLHPSGNTYEWEIGPDEVDYADFPKSLLPDSSKIKKWERSLDGAPEGSRNDSGASMAGKILSSCSPDLWDTVGWAGFTDWNKKNIPPLQDKELISVWESVKKYHVGDGAKQNRGSHASNLLNLIKNRKDIALFCDSYGDPFIAVEVGEVRQIWPCKSKQFKEWLSLIYWNAYKVVLPAEALVSVLNTIKGSASFEKNTIQLESRNAWMNGDLWYDLTNNKWQAIKITKNSWEIIDKPPILFRRYIHNRSQVTPITGGDVKLLLKYFNISDPKQKILILVHMVSVFIPDIAHPILLIHGPQGSCKSTFCRLCRLVGDPSVMEISSLPETHKELVQTIAHNSLLFFDNVSYISNSVSDILCKAVTGSSFPKRELYSDDDDIIYTFKRCLGINGINMVAIRPDLLERSIILELDRIDPKNRKQEKELMEEFKNDLPSIMGGIFDTLVKALSLKPEIKLSEFPRMADFAIWGCAIAEALGIPQQDFLDAYKSNVELQTDVVVNEEIVASTLLGFMQKENLSDWHGTGTELLIALTDYAKYNDIDVYDKHWPKGPNILSRRLKVLEVDLSNAGYKVTFAGGRSRRIDIHKIDDALYMAPHPENLELVD